MPSDSLSELRRQHRRRVDQMWDTILLAWGGMSVAIVAPILLFIRPSLLGPPQWWEYVLFLFIMATGVAGIMPWLIAQRQAMSLWNKIRDIEDAEDRRRNP